MVESRPKATLTADQDKAEEVTIIEAEMTYTHIKSVLF